MVAGTGFLWAPVVITLADWLCAAAMSANLPEGVSFTTVELKTNLGHGAACGVRPEKGDKLLMFASGHFSAWTS